MTTWMLYLLLVVGVARCLDSKKCDRKPEIVCLVNINLDISEEILAKLENCDYIIISYDELCDLTKQLKKFYDAKRIALIRSRTSHAKILRQVNVRFDKDFDADHEIQNIKASLVNGFFNGVELAFDSSLLDQINQIKYAQFLKLLKRNLEEHTLVTSSFVCKQHMPAFLITAMIDVLDYVILMPSNQNVSVEESCLVPRVYSDFGVSCLLNSNFPRNKIVLALVTGGTLVGPSLHQESPSELIPYGNVCDLREEQERHCAKFQHQNCSLFEDGVKLIYDDPNAAARRALQCVGCKLRGISIALSHDDPAGVCVGSSFPLLEAVQNVFENRFGVSGFRGCPFDDTEESEEEEYSKDQLDSDEEGDCCCENGKPCDGCRLLSRLEGAAKTSEHVVSISKNVSDNVLNSLDQVVELVSSGLRKQSQVFKSDQEKVVSITPLTASWPIPPSLIGSDLSTVMSFLSNHYNSSVLVMLPLGSIVSDSQLPHPSNFLNAVAHAAELLSDPTSLTSPIETSVNISAPSVLVSGLMKTNKATYLIINFTVAGE